jgi:hypothetical protein
MKTKQTKRLRSAAERRVASGVDRVFSAPRRVIIMVAPHGNYKLSSHISLFNSVLFGSISWKYVLCTETFFPIQNIYFAAPWTLTPRSGKQVEMSWLLHRIPHSWHLTYGTHLMYTFVLSITNRECHNIKPYMYVFPWSPWMWLLLPYWNTQFNFCSDKPCWDAASTTVATLTAKLNVLSCDGQHTEW